MKKRKQASVLPVKRPAVAAPPRPKRQKQNEVAVPAKVGKRECFDMFSAAGEEV